MKPIKLIIDGINSFKSKQILDFSTLSSGLFCICGDTGAGKSTILDCIILALYGECGRGGGIEYINLERDKAEVEFEFEMDGERYCIWREFVKPVTGEVKKRVRLLKNGALLTSQITETVRIIEDIIGLSIGDFTQVVVLEQGKFSRFLTSGRKDRSITVSKLFHLDKYKDLHRKATSAFYEVEQKMMIIQKVLAAFGDITKESLAADEERLAAVEKQIAANDAEMQNANEKIKELTDLRLAYQKSVGAAKRRDVLTVEIAATAGRLSLITPLIDKDKDVYEGAKEDKNKTALELNRLLDLMPRIAEKAECEQRLTTARARYAELKKTADTLRLNLEGLNQLNEANRQKAYELKGEILGYMDFDDPLQVKAQAEAIAKDFERIFKELSLLKTQLTDCENAEKTHRQTLLRYQFDLQSFRQELDNKTAELINADSDYQGLQMRNSATFVASSLHSGDNCPVCGGVFDSMPSNTNVIDDELDDKTKNHESIDLTNAKKSLEDLRANIKQLEGTASRIEGLISVEQSHIVTEERRKTELNQKIAELTMTLGEFKVKTKEDCIRLVALASNLYATADAMQKTSIETDKTNANLTMTLSTLDEQTLRGKELGAQIERLTNEILQKGGENPEKRRQELIGQANKLTAFILSYEQTQKETAAEISLLNQNLAAKKQELTMLAADIKEVVFSEDEYLAADKTYKDKLAQKSGLAEQSGGLKQAIIRAKEVLADKKLREAEYSKLKKTADKLDRLRKLFHGEKFLEFVADEYISNFTFDASVILNDISGGKYSLVYEQGEGKFYVIDYLNGAKKRKVSTLSGGETFLASLALALSIARHIAAKNYDFFFLDEGFGTLDVKRMDMVADALSQLSKCALVGVISHRHELVERVPTRIRVVASTEDEGSRIMVEC